MAPQFSTPACVLVGFPAAAHAEPDSDARSVYLAMGDSFSASVGIAPTLNSALPGFCPRFGGQLPSPSRPCAPTWEIGCRSVLRCSTGGGVELLADLSVHCGMRVIAVRVQPREQTQPVLGGAAGERGQHQQLHARLVR